VIVGDLDIVGIAIHETKANPPLVVYADGELSGAITAQTVETIASRNLEVVHPYGQIQVLELANRAPRNGRRQLSRSSRLVQLLRVPVRERLDHDKV
jgi:hypothetical protein